MAHLKQAGAIKRSLVVAFSALTLSAVAATPSALAASAHANGKSSSTDKSTTASSHQSQGTAGTSGDPSSPQPVSNADQNSGGANGQCPGGPYCSTRDGSPSGNGNGGGKATGKPCAGCVGKADNKNPKGQNPNGTDNNAGYECDRNHGIGRSNPAHTGCTSGSGTDCTATPDAPECTEGGGTDCTATPDAPECTEGGGTDCTATPDAPECTEGGGGDVCTTTPDAPECVTGGGECSDTMGSEDCTTPPPTTTVLGEKTTRTPTTTPPTTVLGEQVSRTPTGALPFTGANVALLTAIALMTLMVGTAMAVVSRKRSNSTS